MVVKLLAFWTRSEPLTPLRSVRGSAYCCLRRLRLTLSFLDTLWAAYSAALRARLCISAAYSATLRAWLSLLDARRSLLEPRTEHAWVCPARSRARSVTIRSRARSVAE